jgi:hypothetical protein
LALAASPFPATCVQHVATGAAINVYRISGAGQGDILRLGRGTFSNIAAIWVTWEVSIRTVGQRRERYLAIAGGGADGPGRSRTKPRRPHLAHRRPRGRRPARWQRRAGRPIRRVAVASRITPMGRPVTGVEPFRKDGETRSGCRCVERW